MNLKKTTAFTFKCKNFAMLTVIICGENGGSDHKGSFKQVTLSDLKMRP